MAARIKKDDMVYILSGADKGKTGKVVSVDAANQKVVIEGMNLKTKHIKPTQQNPKGGRLQRPAPLAMCKVQPVDPKTGKGTRVKFVTEGGVKKRIAVKTGSDLGVVSKA
ncbi:MAG: 50S ribosomal protein L24 [Phycisphaerae bacterium]